MISYRLKRNVAVIKVFNCRFVNMFFATNIIFCGIHINKIFITDFIIIPEFHWRIKLSKSGIIFAYLCKSLMKNCTIFGFFNLVSSFIIFLIAILFSKNLYCIIFTKNPGFIPTSRAASFIKMPGACKIFFCSVFYP